MQIPRAVLEMALYDLLETGQTDEDVENTVNHIMSMLPREVRPLVGPRIR